MTQTSDNQSVMTKIEKARAIADAIAEDSKQTWAMTEQAQFLAIVACKLFGMPEDQVEPMVALLAAKKEGFTNTSQHLQVIAKRHGWETKATKETTALKSVLAKLDLPDDEEEEEDADDAGE